ncbi:MAG: glycosyltransferase family 2 protein [Bacteroidetes bacterium]|nr:glycosyltransferase family 2 protein [Bacteroidota bacterium]
MKLLIVIPALNEEQSINNIILRTEAAKDFICKNSKVTSIDIIVVSDGSTDKTVEISKSHCDKIGLIVFEKNRGYGAAIKEGWGSGTEADLLAFIDADGTCDPLFFSDLCNLITEKGADVALGSRLNKESEMPVIRRFGNALFSIMLSLVANKRIKDTASGMRVIRKSALHKIMPLPDGLHFTPAMSARAILSDDLTILEKDMPYLEREGESKLRIWKDGKRFLSVILENIFLYIPHKIFNILAFCSILLAILFIAVPLSFYIRNYFLQEWMIYRFIISALAGITGTILLSISHMTKNVVSFTLRPNSKQKKTILYYIFEHSTAILIALLCYFLGTLLVFNSIWDRITTGLTTEHWSRYISMIVLYISGTIVLLSFFTNKILHLVKDRLAYLQSLNRK